MTDVRVEGEKLASDAKEAIASVAEQRKGCGRLYAINGHPESSAAEL
jgi:hypothetical protein